MKKYFSLASALMLALSMGMTSCSNDIDEVVTEKQPEMHKLYLSATAPNSTETRAFVEGVAGYEDAFKITGWKDKDKIYGIYQYVTQDRGTRKNGEPRKVEFTFNGSTNKFESEPTSITNDQIKYFIHGDITSIGGSNKFNDMNGSITVDANFNFAEPFLTVDVEGHSTNLPMWGTASVAEGELTTDMQLASQLAFICLHNTTNSPITVKMVQRYGTADYYATGSRVQLMTSNCYFQYASDNLASAAEKTIPANGKAYLPVQAMSYNTCTVKVIVNDSEFATKDDNLFQAGKVYKLIYPGA